MTGKHFLVDHTRDNCFVGKKQITRYRMGMQQMFKCALITETVNNVFNTTYYSNMYEIKSFKINHLCMVSLRCAHKNKKVCVVQRLKVYKSLITKYEIKVNLL